MSTRLYVVANRMGPMNKGSIVVAVLQRSNRLEPRYKLSTLLFYTLTKLQQETRTTNLHGIERSSISPVHTGDYIAVYSRRRQ